MGSMALAFVALPLEKLRGRFTHSSSLANLHRRGFFVFIGITWQLVSLGKDAASTFLGTTTRVQHGIWMHDPTELISLCSTSLSTNRMKCKPCLVHKFARVLLLYLHRALRDF